MHLHAWKIETATDVANSATSLVSLNVRVHRGGGGGGGGGSGSGSGSGNNASG